MSRPAARLGPEVRHARLHFELAAERAPCLPAFLGSTLRGGLMRAMRRLACVARGVRDCRKCPFLHACTYALLFETPRPKWATRYPTMTTVVHPIVIEPCEAAPERSGEVSFAVRLFGRAVATAPFVIEGVRRMAFAGLGRERARFTLTRVRDGGPDGAPVWTLDDATPDATVTVSRTGSVAGWTDAPGRVTIEFVTATRLVEDSILLRAPTLPALVRAIVFRATTVAYFHDGVDWTADWEAINRAMSSVREVRSDVTWIRLNRFSTRQNQKVPLDGFVGRVTYEGPGLRALVPLLRLGEVLHVGKGTVFGLGGMRIRFTERSDRQDDPRDNPNPTNDGG